MSAKLTTAQTAALRWIAAYTDHGFEGAGRRSETGVRFPNRAMQEKLAAMGYADNSNGMATITDAGRLVIGEPGAVTGVAEQIELDHAEALEEDAAHDAAVAAAEPLETYMARWAPDSGMALPGRIRQRVHQQRLRGIVCP